MIPKKSVVFFYANYDNPVSADEMKYLLLGCSVIALEPKQTCFPFSPKFIEEWKKKGKGNSLKNFPKINWALLCSHDPNSLVLLPYREYIEYVEKNPEDEEKLKEMRVLVEEQSLCVVLSMLQWISMMISVCDFSLQTPQSDQKVLGTQSSGCKI